MQVVPTTTLALLIVSSAAYGVEPSDQPSIEEVLVEGASQSQILEAQTENNVTADAGQMLKNIAGANTNQNGSITSIAQYRGMYGDRINVDIDGMNITSGGPNAMDAPLHYAPASLISSLSIHRGIAPVSAAQQAIGGAIVVETKQGEFSDNNSWQANGEINASYSSANSANNISVLTAIANDEHKIFVSALTQQGDDYRYPEGEVSPSEYSRDRVELGYALKHQQHSFSLSYMDNATGDAGTPALPMDIELVDSQFVRSEYRYTGASFDIKLNANQADIEHNMTNYHLREPMDPSKKRSNFATASAQDAKLATQFTHGKGFINTGVDFSSADHDSDISDPNNAMFFIRNFNQAENTLTGFFIEAQQQLSQRFVLDAGVRFNRVEANADTVDSSMAMMPAVKMLRDNFNNAERKQTDNNIDAVIKLSVVASKQFDIYAGLAQKTRSASYQERYLWLPMQSAGGLADGFNYIGNIELKPEVAREIELGFDWHTQAALVSPRLYYRDISDYIQGTPTTNAQAIMVSQMMGNMHNPLEFSNVEAEIMGFDMPFYSSINDNWAVHGGLSMVRGERKDIDDNLYRIAPDNIRLAADYAISKYKVTAEVVAYNKQNRVSETNNEKTTAGYGLLNAYFNYDVTADLNLLFGVTNLLDKNYQEHLGGINRVQGSDVAVGEHLPGMGRNAYAKVQWQF